LFRDSGWEILFKIIAIKSNLKIEMKNILSFTLALAVVISPALFDRIPTFDFMPALVGGFEALINFLK